MQLYRPVLRIRTAPAGSPVTLSEAKGHLRIAADDDFDDTELQGYLDAAVQLLDGPYGRLSRAIMPQGWTQLQGRPNSSTQRIWLQLATVTAIDAIRYLDESDEAQVLDVANFRKVLLEDAAYIEPSTGTSWPKMADRPDALQIDFTAGYADAASVPATIKQAIRLLVGEWANEREASTPVELREIPIGVDSLIEPYKLGWAR